MAKDVKSNIDIKINSNIKSESDNLKDFNSTLNNTKISWDELVKSAEQYGIVTDNLKAKLHSLNEEFIDFGDVGMNTAVFADNWDQVDDMIDNYLNGLNNLQNINNGQGFDLSKVFNEEQLGTFKNTLNELITTGSISKGTLEGLIGAFGGTAAAIGAVTLAVTLAIKAIEVFNKLLDETIEMTVNLTKTLASGTLDGIKTMLNFGEDAIESIHDGIEWIIDGLKEIGETSQEILENLKEFAEIGTEIQNAYYNIYSLIGSENGKVVSDFANQLSSLYGLDASNLIQGMTDIVSAAASMGQSIDDTTRAIQNMTLYAQDLSVLAGSFEKAQQDIGNAISKGFVSRTSVLYPLMTKNEIKQLKELSNETERYNYLMSLSSRIKGRYLDYLNTESGRIQLLSNQYSALTNNLGKLALGLYAKIAPVLTSLLKIVNAILETFMKIFNIGDLTSSFGDMEGVTAGIADSMNEVAESTDKANKSLASFDDVIQISDNKQDSSVPSVDPGTVDMWGDLLGTIEKTNTELDELIAKVKELFEQGKYFEAGELLANALADWLEGIPWNDIIRKAGEAGKSIAEFLNGFIDIERLWIDIGKTFGKGANTILNFLNEFAKEFHFEQFGKDLVLAWNQFWDTFYEGLAGDTLYNWFMGVVHFATGLLSGDGLQTATRSIAQTIVKFFGNFTTEDINEAVGNITEFINDVFESLGIIVEEFDNSDIQKKLEQVITKLISDFSDNAPQWGQTLGTALSSIFKSAIGLVGAFLDGGGFKPLGDFILNTITGFFNNLSEADIIEAANTLVDLFDNIFTTVGDLVQGLKDSDIVDKLKLFVKTIIGKLMENAGEWGQTLNELITFLLDTASDLLTTKDENGNTLGDAISEFLNGLDLAGILGSWVELKWNLFWQTKWPLLKEKIKQNLAFGLTGLGPFILRLLNFDEIIEGISNWWNNDVIPFFNTMIDAFRLWGDDIKEAFNTFKERTIEKLSEWGQNIKDWFNNIKDTIAEKINNIKEKVSNGMNNIKIVFTNILNGIKNSIQIWWNGIVNIFNTIKQVFTNLWNFIKGIWEKISGVFSNIGSAASGVAGSLGGAIGGLFGTKNASISLEDAPVIQYNIPSIPKLAKGGIVSQGTMFIAGEAGQEAVLPLQQNTAWMDTLASKIASKLSTQSQIQSGNVTIPLGQLTRPTYTRSEMIEFGELCAQALKVYGINISVV